MESEYLSCQSKLMQFNDSFITRNNFIKEIVNMKFIYFSMLKIEIPDS